MADLRALFRQNITKVSTDAKRASNGLVERLKQLTPQEFLRQPPNVFAHLTDKQYREIVAKIAPNTKLPAPPVIEEPVEEKRSLLDWWREQSAFAQSFLVTLFVTIIITLAAALEPLAMKWTLTRAEIVRPISTATWPVCQRLSGYTDGCVYFPSQDLNWDWVAERLDLPVETLREPNRHLSPQFIPRGAQLVIWRYRGHLVEN